MADDAQKKDGGTKRGSPLADWTKTDDSSALTKSFTLASAEKAQQFIRRAVVVSAKLEEPVTIGFDGAKAVSVSLPIEEAKANKNTRTFARKLRNYEGNA